MEPVYSVPFSRLLTVHVINNVMEKILQLSTVMKAFFAKGCNYSVCRAVAPGRFLQRLAISNDMFLQFCLFVFLRLATACFSSDINGM